MSDKKNKGFIFIDFDGTLIDRGVSEIDENTEEDFIKNYYEGVSKEEKNNKFQSILSELIKLKKAGYHLYVLSRNEKSELRDIINKIFVIEAKKEEVDTIINESVFDDIILNDDLRRIPLTRDEKKEISEFFGVALKQVDAPKMAAMRKCKKINEIRSDNSPFILIDDTKDNIDFFNYFCEVTGIFYKKEEKYLDTVLKEIPKNMKKNIISKKIDESSPLESKSKKMRFDSPSSPKRSFTFTSPSSPKRSLTFTSPSSPKTSLKFTSTPKNTLSPSSSELSFRQIKSLKSSPASRKVSSDKFFDGKRKSKRKSKRKYKKKSRRKS